MWQHFAGQPRRHLLTTGWSVFVSSKRLISGDAVLFLRGENGELKLGVRRTIRQRSSLSSSMFVSQNMHLGVLAAAAHAVATKSMFHIFYNPRTSPAEFVIPYHKYAKSFDYPLSAGMRFKMRFETEDTAERRYTGTIMEIGDADPARWPGSKWRYLKVEWDQHAAGEKQGRVSPWEIEPFISATGLNVSTGLRTKRFRTTFPFETTDLCISDGGGLSDFGESSRFQKVLQGQEMSALGAPFRSDGVDSMVCKKWECKGHDTVIEAFAGARKAAGGSRPLSGRSDISASLDLLCSSGKCEQEYGINPFSSREYLPSHCPDTNLRQPIFFTQLQGRENAIALPLSSGSTKSAPWASSSCSLVKLPQGNSLKMQLSVTSPEPVIDDSEKVDSCWEHWQPSGQNTEQIASPGMAAGWQASSFSSCMSEDTGAGSRDSRFLSSCPSKALNKLRDFSFKQHYCTSEISPPQAKDGGIVKGECKIFGFSLTEESVCIDDDVSSRMPKDSVTSEDLHVPAGDGPFQSFSSQGQDILEKDSHDYYEHLGSPKSLEQEISSQRIVKAKSSVQTSGRSCTKVHKQGNAVGRAVDLSKLHGYAELIQELEHLFNMEGLLSDPQKGWHVVYTDNEGDIMLVGDDPWQEFCSIVCKILIYTQEEVEKMTPGMFNDDAYSCFEQQPTTVEVSKCLADQQDSSSPVIIRV